MLFHVKHLHTPDLCPAVNEEVAGTYGRMLRPENREKAGVTVICSGVDLSGHAVYLVLEAASILNVQKFLLPGLGVGTAEVTPIIAIQDATQLVSDGE